MKPLELVELEENDHCTSIRIACEQSISMTCLCFFTKASSLGGLGFCIKTALHLWKLEGFEQKLQGGKTHHTKSSIKPSFLDPNSLTLIF